MASRRRNMIFDNGTVNEALDNAENASKFAQNAILYFLEHTTKHYLTAEEAVELVLEIVSSECVTKESYTHITHALDEMLAALDRISLK